MAAIRVLLVDDHELLREGLKALLEGGDEIQVIATASTSEEGLTRSGSPNLDVVLTDLSLPDHDGFWLLRQLREARPDLPVVILSMHSDQDLVTKALKAGAAGYLTKSADRAEMVEAIQSAYSGAPKRAKF